MARYRLFRWVSSEGSIGREYLSPDIREELPEPFANQGPLLIGVLGSSELYNLNLTDTKKVDPLPDKPLFGDASQHLGGDLSRLAGLKVILGCTLVEGPVSADMLGFPSFSSTLRMKRYSFRLKPYDSSNRL
ncbi:MAG: hypothetical protein WBI82_15985 [Sphaerochaeta sp.]